MKRILLIALLAVSALASAQLKEGKYRILTVAGFMDGKTVYENLITDTVNSYVRVTPTIINIAVAGYSAYTFANVKPRFDKGNWIYITKMADNGNTAAFSYSEKENAGLRVGSISVLRSNRYMDIFGIDLDKK